MADDLYFPRINCQDNADVSRPQPVAVLAIVITRKRAARLIFAPAHSGWMEITLVMAGFASGRQRRCDRAKPAGKENTGEQ